MGYVENTYNITQIEFKAEVQAFCPLGKDYYAAKIYVTMEPGERIMDYCDTDRFIKSLGGKNLIIEDLVSTIHDHINDSYYPNYLKVTAKARSNVHFPVKVTTETHNEY